MGRSTTMDIRDVGGIIGTIGGLVVLYDRYYRGRPVASLTTNKIGDRTTISIRIKNTTAYDVAIMGNKVTRGFLKPCKVYFLTDSKSTRALLNAQTGKPPQFMLKPEEVKELLINPAFENGVALEIKDPGRVDFWIQWRRGNATWLPQAPIAVCTSTEAIRLYGLEDQDSGL